MTKGVKPKYSRYKASEKLEGDERRAALKEYVEHYARIAKSQPELLNQKLPRSNAEDILSEIGGLLQRRAKELSQDKGPVQDFLDQNPVPACLGDSLTEEVRCFSLILNALSQWCASEKQAMDRFLLSGNVRKELKSLYTVCPVSPEDRNSNNVELHHPLRDGRPPVPLSKMGHNKIEGLSILHPEDTVAHQIVDFRKQYSSMSWRRLRVGCRVLLGEAPQDLSKAYIADSRGKANKAKRETGLTESQILGFLDRYELGSLEN